MSLHTFAETELILNTQDRIYHLNLAEEHVADTVLLVGDQDRVARISDHFDTIEHEIHHREFYTHTGTYKGKRITVLSTGIGTDNIDIVVNELHAVVNIDFKTRTKRPNHRALNLIRIGTSGSLQSDIPAGSHVCSKYGLGFDGLLYYYQHQLAKDESELNAAIVAHLKWNENLARPYVIKSSDELRDKIGFDMYQGITATASGFYGPQGRELDLKLNDNTINERLTAFSYNNHRITNFEMECSALYALGKLLGHHCLTCCAILANRETKNFIDDPQKAVDGLIKTVLERV